MTKRRVPETHKTKDKQRTKVCGNEGEKLSDKVITKKEKRKPLEEKEENEEKRKERMKRKRRKIR